MIKTEVSICNAVIGIYKKMYVNLFTVNVTKKILVHL